MIVLKNPHQLARMKDAGVLSANALKLGGASVEPGITTAELDHIMEKYIRKAGAKPSFLHYNGYPASACISVNNVVIHGIPGRYKLKSGDIVSIDVGAFYEGYHGDNAATFACGEILPQAQRLMDVTRESLYEGIKAAVANARIRDISRAVQQHAECAGFTVVREYVGHGVGENMHEEPEVPNYVDSKPRPNPRLVPGMVIAIEPMINQGKAPVKSLSDGWTVETCDGMLSAHFEHTVAITEEGPVILTEPSQNIV